MSVRTEIRKVVTGVPGVKEAVGATEVAVERVRKAAAEAGSLPTEIEAHLTKWQAEVEKAVGSLDPASMQKFLSRTFDPKTLQSAVKEVPALALTRALEVAGKVEHRVEDLTERGKKRLQGAAGESTPVKDAAAEVEQAVSGGAQGTRAAVKRTATKVRTRTESAAGRPAAAKAAKAAKADRAGKAVKGGAGSAADPQATAAEPTED